MPSGNFIDPSDYTSISDSYSQAYRSLLSARSFLYDAVYKIVTTNELEVEIDLLNEFWSSYQINSESFEGVGPFLSSVRSLNNHVLRRAGVNDINEYLDEFSVIVSEEWQILSAAVGMPINPPTAPSPPPPPVPSPPPPPPAPSGSATMGSGTGDFMP